LRLDRYLFFIRLVKSRTLAQGLIEAGHVRIDGRHATKTADEVHVGSVIALPFRGRVRVLRVMALPARRGPASEARLAYEEIDEGGGAT
jgi:ribosome-associated heat shock protein Hsp15